MKNGMSGWNLVLVCMVVCVLSSVAFADVYELRTYTTNEGKLDLLNARFRNHTVKLFEKHGMESVGYWVPTNEPKSKNTLVYILKHKSREAAKASWKAFLSDPEWRKVARESQKDGKFLAKRPDSVFMNAADYAPAFANTKEGAAPVFELRIYRCKEGALKDLNARFKAGTMRIFAKHGIGQVGYWHPCDAPASGDTLIYLLRHKTAEARKASWKAFGGDPEWAEVRSKFIRPLRERPEVTFMKATDYSAIQ
ncbi:MAG: NIPSNAP family protein [Kiritimatiellae bacterium]|nr:NIPSNAP family protein [Kiritimatiellia bacterium]